MGLPANFRKAIPGIEIEIRQFELHRDIRYPVNIDRFLKQMRVECFVQPFEEDVLDGWCIPGDKFGNGREIYINSNKTIPVRRQAKAHELHHILRHKKNIKFYSHVDQVDQILEREANYAAAYYLVPGKCIALCQEWDVGFQELAEQLDVPIGLVMKRYDIYLEMKEHKVNKNSLQLPFEFDL